MDAISQLTYALTGKERLQDCSEDDLQQMVRLYPFFGPAQVLLAKKKKDLLQENEQSSDTTARASLFVPNALWFDQLMNEAPSDVARVQTTIHHTILEEPVTEEEVIEQVSVNEEIMPEEPVVEEEINEQSSVAEDESAAAILPEETVMEEPVTEEEVIEQPSSVREEPVSAVLPEATILEEPATEEEVIEQSPVAETEALSETGAVEEKLEPTVGGEARPEEPAPAFRGLKIEALAPGKMELSFEPYHTVDYFASQGIRFRDDEKPRDRLGIQLKSFTEWLKTLKKAPANETPGAATRQEERKVEQMAQVSISDREVVTEAMAEVWEKQGNAIKAQELYEKLSLQDPAKSAYFAAKIEHLKQL